MAERPRIRMNTAVLSASDAGDLAGFYERLLGWKRVTNQPGWVTLQPEPIGTGLSFQSEAEYIPPVWPAASGEQQMMIHLDLAVDDLEAGEAWALEQGARLAPSQPQDDVRVMLDPAGHPFCLFKGKF